MSIAYTKEENTLGEEGFWIKIFR